MPYEGRAAVNLGFVLFNNLGQVEEAAAAFQVAIDGTDPEQAQLARQNLAAMRQLGADRGRGQRHDIVADAKELSWDAAGQPAVDPLGPPRPALSDRRRAGLARTQRAAPGAPLCT